MTSRISEADTALFEKVTVKRSRSFRHRNAKVAREPKDVHHRLVGSLGQLPIDRVTDDGLADDMGRPNVSGRILVHVLEARNLCQSLSNGAPIEAVHRLLTRITLLVREVIAMGDAVPSHWYEAE